MGFTLFFVVVFFNPSRLYILISAPAVFRAPLIPSTSQYTQITLGRKTCLYSPPRSPVAGRLGDFPPSGGDEAPWLRLGNESKSRANDTNL